MYHMLERNVVEFDVHFCFQRWYVDKKHVYILDIYRVMCYFVVIIIVTRW